MDKEIKLRQADMVRDISSLITSRQAEMFELAYKKTKSMPADKAIEFQRHNFIELWEINKQYLQQLKSYLEKIKADK